MPAQRRQRRKRPGRFIPGKRANEINRDDGEREAVAPTGVLPDRSPVLWWPVETTNVYFSTISDKASTGVIGAEGADPSRVAPSFHHGARRRRSHRLWRCVPGRAVRAAWGGAGGPRPPAPPLATRGDPNRYRGRTRRGPTARKADRQLWRHAPRVLSRVAPSFHHGARRRRSHRLWRCVPGRAVRAVWGGAGGPRPPAPPGAISSNRLHPPSSSSRFCHFATRRS